MPKRCPCGKRASFNVPGKTNPIVCIKCKPPEMINVVAKRCPCGKQSPKFNIPGSTVGVCCPRCKIDGMIDVVNVKCLCGKTPTFNVPGQRPIFCAKCKTNDMVDVKNKKCSCGKQPCFNIPGKTVGICCSGCKTDEMISIDGRICPGYNRLCPVRTHLVNGHEYCMTCDPNDGRRKRYKMFEDAFFAYIEDKINVHKRGVSRCTRPR